MEVIDDYKFSNFFTQVLPFMIAATFAGYTLSGIHPKFLKLFEKWYIQIFIFFLLALTAKEMKLEFVYKSLIHAIVFFACLKVFIYFVNDYYYKKEKQKEMENKKFLGYNITI